MNGISLSFQLIAGNPIDNEKDLSTSLIALVDLARVGKQLKVRLRRAGDRYQPAHHQRTEKLKNLMIENRIPFSQRDHWPIVMTESEEIIWSPGLPVAHTFIPVATTQEIAAILCDNRCFAISLTK